MVNNDGAIEIAAKEDCLVAIKYPAIAAEILPYFQHDKLPDFGKEAH